jgi:hypothetical protein
MRVNLERRLHLAMAETFASHQACTARSCVAVDSPGCTGWRIRFAVVLMPPPRDRGRPAPAARRAWRVSRG